MNVCRKCKINECKFKVCERCKNKRIKEQVKRRKKRGQEIVYIKCKICKKKVSVKKYKEKLHIKKGGKVCKECHRQISSDTMKKTRAKETVEEKKERGRKARSLRTKESCKLATIKQWETIRNDSEKWGDMQKQRSIQGKISWENQTDEQKMKRLKALLSSRSRSKVSEKLKNEMIRNYIYEGFKSEEVFHGFVPDEINHELKIIVEMYGDLYHCNPRRYKDQNLYLKSIGRTIGEQWKRDRIRLACFYKYGYTVVIVWEKDFYNDAEKQIKRIKNEIDKKRKT